MKISSLLTSTVYARLISYTNNEDFYFIYLQHNQLSIHKSVFCIYVSRDMRVSQFHPWVFNLANISLPMIINETIPVIQTGRDGRGTKSQR